MGERDPRVREKRQLKRFRLSGKLLSEMLMLPKGAKIVRISQHNTSLGKCDADIIVYHPDFKPLPSGALIPECQPTYQKEICGNKESMRFISWGREIEESDKTQKYDPKHTCAVDNGPWEYKNYDLP